MVWWLNYKDWELNFKSPQVYPFDQTAHVKFDDVAGRTLPGYRLFSTAPPPYAPAAPVPPMPPAGQWQPPPTQGPT